VHFAKTLNLSAKENLTEAAANLYKMLHELDSCGLDKIYAVLLPPVGIGVAINDRLGKAAG
jgi:L-threonylcarbamoyladenylate synthase